MTTPPRLAFLALFSLTACSPATLQKEKVDDVVIAAPTAATSLVTMTAMPTSDLLRADADGELAVRIRIEAPPLADRDRPVLNLALVVDTSASMEGESIDQVKAAARAVVEQMSARDRLSIVTFSSTASVALASTLLDDDGREAATAAIDAIRATGTTDLAAGLTLGFQEVWGHRTGGIDRMVLIADGFPNDPDPIPVIVDGAAQNGIPITTLGIGVEASDQMLDAIATKTGGSYRYAPDGTQVAELFRKEILRMKTLVASSLVLELTAGPGIELAEAAWLTGTPRRRNVILGDLAAGEVRDVFVPVKVPGHKPDLTVEILDARLGFMDALSGTAQQRTAFVGVRSTNDADAIAKATHVDLARGNAQAAANGAIILAINYARMGQVDQAKTVLAAAEDEARARAKELADEELVAIAERMKELARNLAQIRTPIVSSAPPGLLGGGAAVQAAVAPPTLEEAMTNEPASAPPSVDAAIKIEYDHAKQSVTKPR
jgi:Ca-activated chloride channel homolog